MKDEGCLHIRLIEKVFPQGRFSIERNNKVDPASGYSGRNVALIEIYILPY